MLTKLTIRNFKRFGEEVEIELGNPVVFIGPNNSGKTTAIQALALWDIGIRRWHEKRSGKDVPGKRPGVIISRRDLVSIPVTNARLLWHGRNVRQGTNNIRVDVIVEGVTHGQSWTCGLEFDYRDEETFYCRPLRISKGDSLDWMQVPDKEMVAAQQVAFLPPMSGLAATETRLGPGAINVRIGEGRTAEVLRNLCYRISEEQPPRWKNLVVQIQRLFGAELQRPELVIERDEIEMKYKEHGVELDLSSAGRGLQQTLLMLAYMFANPGAVLLLDEPDAHLEILRQGQNYRLLSEVARESDSQIIAASHSEVLLKQAAQEEEDKVIAFIGRKPHRIDSNRVTQVLKALTEIEFDQYYLAEQTGWVLYLEGSTDLTILQSFAARLGHVAATRALERPFVRSVGNQPSQVRSHFHGLREACPELIGVALFDRLEREPPGLAPVEFLMWKRREIENYLSSRATLEAYAATLKLLVSSGPLFEETEAESRRTAMEAAITETEAAMASLDRGSPWDYGIKVSDEFLKPLFASYFRKLGLRNRMTKKHFHELVKHIPEDEIAPEINEKLDAIARVAQQAMAKTGGGGN
ncbi:MAG: AAA family ATPase [Anaerolineaceae bacterium]|nr:AAA family ATPase [Anaerolineaceae bacterium]